MRTKLIGLFVALGVAAGAAEVKAVSLWASDSDSGSSSTLFELDAATGAQLSSIPGPGVYADALSFTNDGQYIWVLDSSTNGDVYRIDLTGAVQQQFHIPLDAEGLTVLANNSLVVGGGNSNAIAFVNPTTGAIISQFTPAGPTFGLASNGVDELYGLRINGIIDTYDLSGNLLGSLNTGVGGATLGLAYTGSSFFISATGSTITEVDLAGNVLNSYPGPGIFTEGLDYPTGIQVRNFVPEPASATLGLLGLAALGLRRRRRTA